MSSQELQNVIKKSFQDPITNLLLKNSNLTRTQFETIIIDLLTDIISDEKVTFYQKTLFRSKLVSRGSFSRSLSQARKNIITSIFTIILLNYVGVFSSRVFDDYEFLSEKLREYLSIIESTDINSKKKLLIEIETELIEGIQQLATPTSIKIT
jgi:hypothetical protein